MHEGGEVALEVMIEKTEQTMRERRSRQAVLFKSSGLGIAVRIGSAFEMRDFRNYVGS